MRFIVNENCIGCELCNALCPEAFEMGEDGLAHFNAEDVASELADTAMDAMNSCPVGAIEEVE